jgi:hypothetical protein
MEWRSRVDKLNASGMKLPEFCRREGLSQERLRYWKWYLARQDKVALVSTTPPFVPVTVAPSEPSSATASFEVCLRSGHTIRIPAAFDEGSLLRLIAVLGGA